MIATPNEKLQALKTLNPAYHIVRRDDMIHIIDLMHLRP